MNQPDLLAALCVVCGQAGAVTKKALNGLPTGIVACDECRDAVKRRQVGVAVLDGQLHVTDGRRTHDTTGA